LEVERVGVGYGVVDPKVDFVYQVAHCVIAIPCWHANSEIHHFLCQTKFHPVFTRLSFFLSSTSTAAATYIFTASTC
jgi:fumarate reductase subunit D